MDYHKDNKHDVILQWNINGLLKNHRELVKLLNEFNPICLSLNETRIEDPSNIFKSSFKNYTPHFIPNIYHKGNLLMIRKDIPFSILPITTSLNAIAIECHRDKSKFRICSIYLSPSIPINLQELQSLAIQLSSGGIPFMLLGDFNARSEYWHDPINNDRGNKIVDFILQSDLEILNNDSPTHFNLTHGSLTHIDLSLCSQRLSPDLYWHTYHDLCSSDHFPILIHFINQAPIIRKHHWNLKRADWANFTEMTKNISYQKTIPVSQNLQNFMELTFSAAKKCIPYNSRIGPRTHAIWWNEECKEAKRTKNKARRKFLKTRDNVDFIEFKRLKAKARLTYRQAHKESWKLYVSEIRSETPISKIWKKINKLRGRYKGAHIPTLKVNNESIIDPSKVANIIAGSLNEISKGRASTDRIFASVKETAETIPIDFTDNLPHNYNSAFSLEEYLSALKNSSESAPGEDTISIPIIKHLHINATHCLLDIFNELYSSNYFPPEWRHAIVLPFLKPGKDPSSPLNYRPIALTSCICKLLERMVNTRLMWYLEDRNYLSLDQYGFRKNRSCLDPLTHLDHDIGNAFKNNKFVTAIFFDMEKAYDTVWRRNILEALYNKKLRGNLPTFISNFLSPRYFKVDVHGNSSDSFLQHEGVPQGSILSTSCFILAIDNIVKYLPANIKRSLYVDDFAIWCMGNPKEFQTTQKLLQQAVNSIAFFAQNRGFKISTSKTVTITFSKKDLPDKPSLNLLGHPINYAPKVRFLGMLLDEKMSWKPHIEALRNSCRPILNLLRNLSYHNWGADRATLLYLHSTLILSKLDFGSHLYMSASKRVLKRLDPIHNEGLRIATGAFKDSRIQSLYVETNYLPLKYRRALNSMKFYSRILSSNSRLTRILNNIQPEENLKPRSFYPFTVRIKQILKKFNIPDLNILKSVFPSYEPWKLEPLSICHIKKDIKKGDLPPHILHQEFLKHSEEHLGAIPVYTDGSKSESGVGFAAVLPFRIIKGKLPNSSSILSAEISAIYCALFALNNINLNKNSQIVIYSDSQSALQSLISYDHQNPLVINCKIKIHRLSQKGHRTLLCWTPSHVGIRGNEIADHHAKTAIETANNTYPTYYKDYNSLFGSQVKKHWQSKWTTLILNDPRPDLLERIKPKVEEWPSSLHKSRKKEVILCRIRLGHTRLTHGYRMAKEPRVLCNSCNIPLTVEHLLIECPCYLSFRSQFFGPSPTLDSILNDENVNENIFLYLDSCDLTKKL